MHGQNIITFFWFWAFFKSLKKINFVNSFESQIVSFDWEQDTHVFVVRNFIDWLFLRYFQEIKILILNVYLKLFILEFEDDVAFIMKKVLLGHRDVLELFQLKNSGEFSKKVNQVRIHSYLQKYCFINIFLGFFLFYFFFTLVFL